jgi:hypothetical protein
VTRTGLRLSAAVNWRCVYYSHSFWLPTVAVTAVGGVSEYRPETALCLGAFAGCRVEVSADNNGRPDRDEDVARRRALREQDQLTLHDPIVRLFGWRAAPGEHSKVPGSCLSLACVVARLGFLAYAGAWLKRPTATGTATAGRCQRAPKDVHAVVQFQTRRRHPVLVELDGRGPAVGRPIDHRNVRNVVHSLIMSRARPSAPVE